MKNNNEKRFPIIDDLISELEKMGENALAAEIFVAKNLYHEKCKKITMPILSEKATISIHKTLSSSKIKPYTQEEKINAEKILKEIAEK